YYFGGTGGGVFKTTDGGVTWEPVSDGQPFGTGTVGAIEVSLSDPNVVYVGMGEACIRGNFSHGDGVYKSTDAGKTWKRVGLEDSRVIGRIRIHPKNPDLVYVAALGHAAGPNDQRGVFRSKDGGKNWERVLFKSNKAGAVDLSMDPSNSNVLYASLCQPSGTPRARAGGRPGAAPPQAAGRRRPGEGGCAPPRGAEGRGARADRRGRSPRQSGAPLGAHRSRGRRRLPFGQRGQELDEGQR